MFIRGASALPSCTHLTLTLSALKGGEGMSEATYSAASRVFEFFAMMSISMSVGMTSPKLA